MDVSFGAAGVCSRFNAALPPLLFTVIFFYSSVMLWSARRCSEKLYWPGEIAISAV
jgi:hypothetical protein